MYSILAGIMIAVGGCINLQVGGIWGALFFSIGLLTILTFNFDLFTGKAGLLATNQVTWKRISGIWFGNLFGVALMAALMSLTPLGATLSAAAQVIAVTRLTNGFLANIILGGGCGILMYIAVTLFEKSHNPLYAIMPVATFILCGFNHCIADMFYFAISDASLNTWLTLIPTTLGNICGAIIIPIAQNWQKRYYPQRF